MARKIGDLAIGIIFLLFIGASLSLFLNSADSTLGISSGVTSDLDEITNSGEDYYTLETETTQRLYTTGDFVVEGDTQVETRGTNVVGIMSLFQNNIMTRLQSKLSEKLKIHPDIIKLGSLLIILTISILTIRFIWGETKV